MEKEKDGELYRGHTIEIYDNPKLSEARYTFVIDKKDVYALDEKPQSRYGINEHIFKIGEEGKKLNKKIIGKPISIKDITSDVKEGIDYRLDEY